MQTFSFISVWNFEGALLEPVWNALSAIEDWPSWWTGVEQVEVLDRGGPDRVGFRSLQTWKSKLPYRLRFQGRIDRVEPMRRIEISSEGELQGTGLMRFAHSGTSTVFQYDWNVATTKAWMNLVAPLAKRLFSWNHGIIMDWGAAGLARKLRIQEFSTSEKPYFKSA
jgi:hypothetical protein